MADYTISETFTLPSKGLIYNVNVPANITLRSMNTRDEMRRLSTSEYQYKPMCDVVDDCIIDDTGISCYDMCIGDYQFLLYKLRIVTYGSDFDLETTCPFCKFHNKDTINLDALNVLTYDESIHNYMSFDLPVTKKHVKIKFTTPRMLDNIGVQAREMKQRSTDKSQDYSMLTTLTSIIDTVDGQERSVMDLEKWVRELPMLDIQYITAHADKLNNSFGIDNKLEVECEVCTLPYITSFRINSEFFRPTINI